MDSLRNLVGSLVVLVAVTCFNLLTAYGNPVEWFHDFSVELTDDDTAVYFEYTSLRVEDRESIDVQWKNDGSWVTLDISWEKCGTVTQNNEELPRFSMTVPCPDEGSHQFRAAEDMGPENELLIHVADTFECSGEGVGADEVYDPFMDESLENCSAVSVGSQIGLIGIIGQFLF